MAGKAKGIDEGTTQPPVWYEKAFRLTELNTIQQLELTVYGPAGCTCMHIEGMLKSGGLLHSFLTSESDGDNSQLHAPTSSPPGAKAYGIYTPGD
jgi:hypothetical protein